jgi:hypothetical protein
MGNVLESQVALAIGSFVLGLVPWAFQFLVTRLAAKSDKTEKALADERAKDVQEQVARLGNIEVALRGQEGILRGIDSKIMELAHKHEQLAADQRNTRARVNGVARDHKARIAALERFSLRLSERLKMAPNGIDLQLEVPAGAGPADEED